MQNTDFEIPINYKRKKPQKSRYKMWHFPGLSGDRSLILEPAHTSKFIRAIGITPHLADYDSTITAYNNTITIIVADLVLAHIPMYVKLSPGQATVRRDLAIYLDLPWHVPEFEYFRIIFPHVPDNDSFEVVLEGCWQMQIGEIGKISRKPITLAEG